MPDSRQPSRSRLVRHTVLAGVLFAALGQVASAQTARVGHARMVSASGQPLAVELTLRGLAPEQRDSLTVSAAPSPAWSQAGLTPPVALESLSFQVVPGPVATSQVVRVRSDQAFHGDIADLLVNIQTGSGQLQHQVSVMAPDARSPVVALAVQQGGGDAAAPSTASASAAASAPTSGDVTVRRGDTLFSIARSQAVPGVSVYQMMMALQAVNPQAFIDGNVNRLKAGATLRLPSTDELSVLSDVQARRLFAEQGEAFAAYRERIAGLRGDAVSADTSRGQIGQAQASTSTVDAGQSRDQLVLSSGSEASADDKAAADKNIADSRGRISELEQNVADLNQAISGQGTATAANGNAENGDNDASGTGQGQSDVAGLSSASAQASAAQAQVASPADSAAADAAQPKSWWQENMLGIVTGLLALLVLLVVWLLRRAGVNRGEAERGSPITEDMVKQKLEEINLDFQNDTDSKPRSGGPSA